MRTTALLFLTVFSLTTAFAQVAESDGPGNLILTPMISKLENAGVLCQKEIEKARDVNALMELSEEELYAALGEASLCQGKAVKVLNTLPRNKTQKDVQKAVKELQQVGVLCQKEMDKARDVNSLLALSEDELYAILGQAAACERTAIEIISKN